MDIFKRPYYRICQKVAYVAAFFLPWRQPYLLKGVGKFTELPDYIKNMGINNVLVVTDQGLMQAGLLEPMLAELVAKGIKYTLFDGVVPNPTIDNVETCVKLYHDNGCTGIIAVGGGSPMDCAKITGARIARPKRPVTKMRGMLKVGRKLPPLFAVPTTSGTASETTLAAVITDSVTHHKYPINDPALIPYAAVLDPSLTLKLPPYITATTGMDALCHAVEAYIGKANTAKTKQEALTAVKLIFANILKAYQQGEDIEARTNMQEASYHAGLAFTRAYVGWVHAIAHTLGGFYQVPHGLANAVIMPYVFRAYGKNAHPRLAELADAVGLGGVTTAEKAERFIKAIEDLNARMDLPAAFPEIREEDIEQMVSFADAEANPLYPTPKILLKKDIRKIYAQLKGGTSTQDHA